MGLLGLYMGKVSWVWKKLVGSAVFLKLVRPLVFSDPACAENCVPRKNDSICQGRVEHQKLKQKTHCNESS